MSREFDHDFDVRPGRPRDRGAGGGRRARSFVQGVLAAAGKARGARLGAVMGTNSSGTPAGRGRCSRIGRGQKAVERLRASASQQKAAGFQSRRVVVKARIVRLKLGGHAAMAHLRYLQRDGVTRDGERGQLYGPGEGAMDGMAFIERGEGDRHQFRFIVAPEDGDRLLDLRAFTREVMSQVEADLGTRLDWVAVDHFNTGHPHSHVIVRGKDEFGKDLIIAQDYITEGVRLRAQERANLELGPETDLELREKLKSEIGSQRFTRIDRAMIEEADDGLIDLRPDAGQVRAELDATLRVGRLKTLERLGLAQEAEPGLWALREDLEPTLRALGERGDIIKAINRALAQRGEARSPDRYVLFAGQEPVIGRVIGKHLTDELGDRVALVVDGVDGRTHHIAGGDAASLAEVKTGVLIEVAPAGQTRRVDQTVAALAREDDGLYRPSVHERRIASGELEAGKGDAGDLVESRVRRLEALRRAGVVERLSDDLWSIPADFEARAGAYDAARGRSSNIRLLSAFDLDKQVTSDGATWLDRQLISRSRVALTRYGFGAEVEQAFEARKQVLVDQGHATRRPDGAVTARRDLLVTLERQELTRVGEALAKQQHARFRMAEPGETLRGKLAGDVQLASGKYAVLDTGLELSLVPWRPVLERYRGQSVAGTMEIGGGISWSLGRQRGLGI